MRLSEIDLEPQGLDYDAKSLVQYVEANAQPWIEASLNLRLSFVRGIRTFSKYPGSEKAVFIRNVRRNRDPKDTAPERHKMFNAAIQAAGGIANRSNSIFVTSSMAEASVYGDVYIVVPLGEFHYTWSPKWADWTAQAKTSAFVELLRKNPNIPEQYSDFGYAKLLDDPNSYPDEIKDLIWFDRDLEKAYYSTNEVMISCNTALFISRPVFAQMREHLK